MKVISLRRPRLSSRSVRSSWAATGLLAVSLAAGLSACSFPSASPASAAMSCEQATHDLANANSALAAAQALQPEAGTPDEKKKTDKVAAAQADVDRLTAVKSKACEVGATSTATSTASATSASTPTPTAISCPETWPVKVLNHDQFRLVAEGIPSIKAAKTPAEAAKALLDYIDLVKSDPGVLAGVIKTSLHEDVLSDALVSGDCMSPAAKVYVARLFMTAGASQVEPSNAPANGVNTGVQNGQVVSAVAPGVHGDTTAIKVTQPDGTQYWVLYRCGNIVAIIPIFTPGPTDNNGQVCESGPDKDQPVGTDGVCAKNPGQDPQSRGQVPGQGTKNGPSTDNGTEVSHPATPPRDSGNGVPPGTPPRATPSPAPTHSGGPVVPPPTEPPAPLPSPQPTQTASVPPPPPPPA